MAEDAATVLPLELSWVPPLFPSYNFFSNSCTSGAKPWLEFLYLISPSAFETEFSWPRSGCRVARLRNSPFFASVHAIDELLSSGGPAFIRRFREAAVRFNTWLDDNDRTAALDLFQVLWDQGAAIPGGLPSPFSNAAPTVAVPVGSETPPMTGVDAISTLGDLLWSVRAVEVAAADTRNEAERLGADPSSGWNWMQAGVFEATAVYKQHPLFPALEAHVNSRYGGFTHANLLRVRGDVALQRNCGSTDADRLLLDEVIVVLRASRGNPSVATQGSVSIPSSISSDPTLMNPPYDDPEQSGVYRLIDIGDALAIMPHRWREIAFLHPNGNDAAIGEQRELWHTVFGGIGHAAGTFGASGPDTLRAVPFMLVQRASAEVHGDSETTAILRALGDWLEQWGCAFHPFAPVGDREAVYRNQEALSVEWWLQRRRLTDALTRLGVALPANLMGRPSLSEHWNMRELVTHRDLMGWLRQVRPQPLTFVPAASAFAPVSPPAIAASFRLVSSGPMWEVSGFGECGLIPNLMGVRNLIQLLRSTGQVVPWADLLLLPAMGTRARQPTLDTGALNAIRKEQKRLRDEINTAENDVERADSQERLDAIETQIKKDLGLGNNPRDLNSPIDGYRSKVHGRLNKVYAKMRIAMEPLTKLASHFEQWVSSRRDGFIYEPLAPAPPWHLDLPQK